MTGAFLIGSIVALVVGTGVAWYCVELIGSKHYF